VIFKGFFPILGDSPRHWTTVRRSRSKYAAACLGLSGCTGQVAHRLADSEDVMLDNESVTAITSATSMVILLAEDDPVTRMLMTRFLKRAGYEVDAVADGSEALDHMTQRYYPILITDWEMPEMDGVELCKAVRSLQLDGYVYTLLLTGRVSKEHVITGLEAGADDYLVKPGMNPS
jgi:CheY-like chemotaxis protein